MLYEFLATNHDELVKRCRAKGATRHTPTPPATELEYGVAILLDELVDTLRAEQAAPPDAEPAKVSADIGSTAEKHGNELLRTGFTVDQVVHDYGDLCQAVTELAHETEAPITVDEFHTFNRCLDNAIADAVTEFGRQRDQYRSEEGVETMNERLGGLAHELRNGLNSAMLALEAIKGGHGSLQGATGAVLTRSLIGLRYVVDCSLADVRLTHQMKVRPESVPVRDLLDDLRIAAAMEAEAKGLVFTIPPVDGGLVVDADRQMLSSAIANLLQNAFKYTEPEGRVSLTAHAAAERIVIEVEDECGGLSEGKTEVLFRPFEQRNGDRTGLGLGLSISRRGVEANGGKLRVRNLPGKGCIFTIDLPRPAPKG
jgi:signal transduction histidine kinase